MKITFAINADFRRILCSLAMLSVVWSPRQPLTAQAADRPKADVDPIAAGEGDVWTRMRRQMVDREIVAAGIDHERVVAAMRDVPRHEFVTPDQRPYAYFDMCLPIGAGQTISPPFMVASMTQRLAVQPTDKVLEIGTGSGYQAAVLSGLVKDVYTIEIVSSLNRRASATLRRLGYRNIHARLGDGYQGWPQYAPFDKIIVTCSPENIPQPLIDQLKEGGRLAIPVGQRFQQTLYLFKKVDGKLVVESREPTMFVPMTGRAEEQRRLKPDPFWTGLVNGGFEQRLSEAENQPVGWYYVRQAEVVAEPGLPAGGAYLKITNATPGRAAQALQGIGVDGRQITDLELSYWVRLRDARLGAEPDQAPKISVTFFDADRAPIGQAELVAGLGSAAWTKRQGCLKVPRSTRLAVLSIGLLGATGEASFHAIELGGLKRPAVDPALDARIK